MNLIPHDTGSLQQLILLKILKIDSYLDCIYCYLNITDIFWLLESNKHEEFKKTWLLKLITVTMA